MAFEGYQDSRRCAARLIGQRTVRPDLVARQTRDGVRLGSVARPTETVCD